MSIAHEIAFLEGCKASIDCHLCYVMEGPQLSDMYRELTGIHCSTMR